MTEVSRSRAHARERFYKFATEMATSSRPLSDRFKSAFSVQLMPLHESELGAEFLKLRAEIQLEFQHGSLNDLMIREFTDKILYHAIYRCEQ